MASELEKLEAEVRAFAKGAGGSSMSKAKAKELIAKLGKRAYSQGAADEDGEVTANTAYKDLWRLADDMPDIETALGVLSRTEYIDVYRAAVRAAHLADK